MFDFQYMEIYRPNVFSNKQQQRRHIVKTQSRLLYTTRMHTCMCRCIHKCIRLFLFRAVFFIHLYSLSLHIQFIHIFLNSWVYYILSALYRYCCAFLIRIQFRKEHMKFEAHIFEAQIHKRLIIQWYTLTQKPHIQCFAVVAYHLQMYKFTISFSCIYALLSNLIKNTLQNEDKTIKLNRRFPLQILYQ